MFAYAKQNPKYATQFMTSAAIEYAINQAASSNLVDDVKMATDDYVYDMTNLATFDPILDAVCQAIENNGKET